MKKYIYLLINLICITSYSQGITCKSTEFAEMQIMNKAELMQNYCKNLDVIYQPDIATEIKNEYEARLATNEWKNFDGKKSQFKIKEAQTEIKKIIENINDGTKFIKKDGYSLDQFVELKIGEYSAYNAIWLINKDYASYLKKINDLKLIRNTEITKKRGEHLTELRTAIDNNRVTQAELNLQMQRLENSRQLNRVSAEGYANEKYNIDMARLAGNQSWERLQLSNEIVIAKMNLALAQEAANIVLDIGNETYMNYFYAKEFWNGNFDSLEVKDKKTKMKIISLASPEALNSIKFKDNENPADIMTSYQGNSAECKDVNVRIERVARSKGMSIADGCKNLSQFNVESPAPKIIPLKSTIKPNQDAVPIKAANIADRASTPVSVAPTSKVAPLNSISKPNQEILATNPEPIIEGNSVTNSSPQTSSKVESNATSKNVKKSLSSNTPDQLNKEYCQALDAVRKQIAIGNPYFFDEAAYLENAKAKLKKFNMPMPSECGL